MKQKHKAYMAKIEAHRAINRLSKTLVNGGYLITELEMMEQLEYALWEAYTDIREIKKDYERTNK